MILQKEKRRKRKRKKNSTLLKEKGIVEPRDFVEEFISSANYGKQSRFKVRLFPGCHVLTCALLKPQTLVFIINIIFALVSPQVVRISPEIVEHFFLEFI